LSTLNVFILAGAAAIGGLIAWFAARAKAAAAGARVQELRGQLAVAQRDLTQLRQELSQSEQARAAAEVHAQDEARQAVEQARLLEEAKGRLTDSFKSLAADVLAGSNRSFLQLAEERFKALREESTGDLQSRQQAIAALLTPLAQALDAYQRETRELEQRRHSDLGGVGQQLRQVAESHTRLHAETARLVNALRSPHVRGRWGEIALRRTAELAGMSAYCDFGEQEAIPTENGRLRPDMVVHLPAGREVIVDSKVPLVGYLDALDAIDESSRLGALDRHVTQLRQHVMKLASKSYAEQLTTSPEFVVLFIPNDSFLAAAAERDPNLVDWALAQQVVLATPATFVALLRAIAYGWRQAKVAENAQRISEVGRELAERMTVLVDHLSNIGGAIGKAVESYNKAVGSLESRVLPAARKLDALDALDAETKPELPELEPIEQTVRQLAQQARLDLDAPG
jgi:DNA recombination protein RmuC